MNAIDLYKTVLHLTQTPWAQADGTLPTLKIRLSDHATAHVEVNVQPDHPTVITLFGTNPRIFSSFSFIPACDSDYNLLYGWLSARYDWHTSTWMGGE